jgi:uncharacterized glyoxalase superfamily protein PhnB
VTITTIERKRYDCQHNSEKDIFWAENEVFKPGRVNFSRGVQNRTPEPGWVLERLREEVIFNLKDLQPTTDWFARPVLQVRDVEASLLFYVDRLGFTSPWRYDEDGRARVAQVERQGCALILADTWAETSPEKVGKGLIFISLNVEPHSREAATAALDELRAELEARGVAVKDGSWGYRLLVVDDLDGNQLFFNYPGEQQGETASGVMTV